MKRSRNYSQRTTTNSAKNFQNTVKEQGNIEARDMFMIADAIQCQTTCCTCVQTQSRNKFSKTSWIVPTHSRRAHALSELGHHKRKQLFSQLCHTLRDLLKTAKKKQKKLRFLIDIKKVTDVEHIFSQKGSPKTVTDCDGTQKENTSPLKVNVNSGKARATWSKQQQVAKTLWLPQSIPICQKERNGIESISVDKETKLPRNHRLPAASGKIGVVGNVGKMQARHQTDGKGRTKKIPSPQIGRPAQYRSRTETAPSLRENDSVIWTSTPRSERGLWINAITHARMFSAHQALRAGTHSCRCSAALLSVQTNSHFALAWWYLTRTWSDTIVRPCHCKFLVLLPQCATAQTHLHLALLWFAHNGHQTHFSPRATRCTTLLCNNLHIVLDAKTYLRK